MWDLLQAIVDLSQEAFGDVVREDDLAIGFLLCHVCGVYGGGLGDWERRKRERREEEIRVQLVKRKPKKKFTDR